MNCDGCRQIVECLESGIKADRNWAVKRLNDAAGDADSWRCPTCNTLFESKGEGARRGWRRRPDATPLPVHPAPIQPTTAVHRTELLTVYESAMRDTAEVETGGLRYEARHILAEGGMGRIVITFDHVTGREVALKELLPQFRTGNPHDEESAAVVKMMQSRFLREARITAQLEHPNIVPVYDMGVASEGSHYYTMMYVKGRTLHEVLDELNPKISSKTRRALVSQRLLGERLKLLDAFVDVCNAVAFAHSKGVIHRDLKPMNIVVSDFGQTKVLDWGLARTVRKKSSASTAMLAIMDPGEAGGGGDQTVAGTIVGTPRYMSPEQARGDIDAVDEKSDVYSLGAILYEIVTGFQPYGGRDAVEVVTQVLTGPPPRPIEREPRAPKELCAVIERAMARDPAERMVSALELAREVQAFRDGRSLSTYRYSVMERVTRFARRNIWVVAAVIAVIALLSTATFVSIRFARVADREASSARRAEREAETRADSELAARRAASEETRRANGLRLAASSLAECRDDPTVALLLAIEASQRAPGRAATNALMAAIKNLRLIRWFEGHETVVHEVALSPDDTLFASGDRGGVVMLREAATGNPVMDPVRHDDGVIDIGFSPDGGIVASVGADHVIHLIDAKERRDLGAGRGHADRIVELRWSADGAKFATASMDGSARVWTRLGRPESVLGGHEGGVSALSWSPNGRRLATGSNDGSVRIFAIDGAGSEPIVAVPLGSPVTALDWHPLEATIALATADGRLLLMDAESGELRPTRESLATSTVTKLRYKPDGSRIALETPERQIDIRSASGLDRLASVRGALRLRTASFDPDWRRAVVADYATAQIVDLETGEVIGRLAGHEYWLQSAVFSRDGKRLLTGSADRRVALWHAPPYSALPRIEARLGANDPRSIVDVGPLSHLLVASRGEERRLELVDFESGTTVGTLLETSAEGTPVAFNEAQDRIIVLDRAKERVVVFDRLARTVSETEIDEETAELVMLGGDFAAVELVPTRARIFDLRTGRPVADLPLRPMAASADGRFYARAPRHGIMELFDASGRVIKVLEGHTGTIVGARFSADSKRLVTTAADASIRIWSTETFAMTSYIRWPRIDDISMVMDPGNERLAAWAKNTARLFDLANGTELASFTLIDDIAGLGFMPDGALSIRYEGGAIETWRRDLEDLARSLAPRPLTPLERERHEID